MNLWGDLMYYVRKDNEDNVSLVVSLTVAILVSFIQYKQCNKSGWNPLTNFFLSVVLFFILSNSINGVMYLVFKIRDRHKTEKIKRESIIRIEKERVEKEKEEQKQKAQISKTKSELINNILNSLAFTKIADIVIQKLRGFKFQSYYKHLKFYEEVFCIDQLLDSDSLYEIGIAVDHRSELVEALAIHLNANKKLLETNDICIISMEAYQSREDSPGYDALRIEFFNKKYIEPKYRL